MTESVSKYLLVVDDDLFNRKLLETLLTAEGYVVRSCDSGPAGLEAVAQRSADGRLPDAILLDALMPGMDGFEFARRLKADPVACRIPLVMVTALDGEDSRGRVAAAGISRVLNKPFDRGELKALLTTLFGEGGGTRG
jgi:CheY-like chemotaxis protein